MNVKLSDLGWFYHAPPRPKQRERVIPPPPSQIPGLSDVSHLPEPDQKRVWIKESDSKYIQLAKMGGRQDLLCHNGPDVHSDEPVGYPRCEWYYDNVAPPPDDDDCCKEPYQFMLPSYMVFQPNAPPPPPKKTTDDKAAALVKGPYTHDSSTVYDREGNGATDKTMKLDEPRQSGYGVRAEKQQRKQAAARKPQCADNVCSYACNAVPRPPNFTQAIAKDGADMKKILSYSYAADYNTQKQQYAEQQEVAQQQKECASKQDYSEHLAQKCHTKAHRKC